MYVVDRTLTWPPRALGDPSVTGVLQGVRYAHYTNSQRLAVADGEYIRVYATRGARIEGFSVSDGGVLTFMLDGQKTKLTKLRLVGTAAQESSQKMREVA